MKTFKRMLLASVVLAGMVAFFPSVSEAQLSEAQVKEQLEKAYGVMVLRVRALDDQGKAAYAVTMMNPPGNFNEALQVNTIVVDRETGAPISQYRPQTSGVQLAARPRVEPPIGFRLKPPSQHQAKQVHRTQRGWRAISRTPRRA